MKIVQFILTLGAGGAESVVKDYAIELKRRGHEIEVLTLRPFSDTNNEKMLKRECIKLRSIYEEIYLFQSDSFVVRALRKPFRLGLVSKWLQRYIEDNKPDVIHIHLTLYSYFIPIADNIKNVRLVFTCHNEAYYYFGKKNNKDISEIRYLIKNNHLKIVALHERMAKELNVILGSQDTYVINNPIDTERFFAAKKYRESKRKELGIPNDAFVLGHVGRFTYQKNHEMLVEIFKMVCDERHDAFLLMVGDGELKSDIECKLSSYGLTNRYKIVSNRTDVAELLGSMDVFIFPSRFEGFSIAFLEAQASGVKCVGTNVMPDSIIMSSNAKLLGVDDNIEMWKKEICANEYNENMSERLQQYDIKLVVNKLLEIYSKME